MKKLILFLIAIITLIQVTNTYKEDYYVIPNESIRIRIVPNSDSIEDQFLKKQVKTNIELEIASDLKDSKTIEESRNIINNNIKNYGKTVEKVLKEEKTNQ